MPYVHEFGIIENIGALEYDIGYAPEKYGCITVDGDVIDELCTTAFQVIFVTIISTFANPIA